MAKNLPPYFYDGSSAPRFLWRKDNVTTRHISCRRHAVLSAGKTGLPALRSVKNNRKARWSRISAFPHRR